MTVRRRYIDPRTRDYVLERGTTKNDETIASTVVLLLATERGSSPARPRDGSRLHTLKKATPDAGRLAEEYAIEALAPVNHWLRGLQATATVVSERTGARLDLIIAYYDRSGVQRRVPYSRSL